MLRWRCRDCKAKFKASADRFQASATPLCPKCHGTLLREADTVTAQTSSISDDDPLGLSSLTTSSATTTAKPISQPPVARALPAIEKRGRFFPIILVLGVVGLCGNVTIPVLTLAGFFDGFFDHPTIASAMNDPSSSVASSNSSSSAPSTQPISTASTPIPIVDNRSNASTALAEDSTSPSGDATSDTNSPAPDVLPIQPYRFAMPKGTNFEYSVDLETTFRIGGQRRLGTVNYAVIDRQSVSSGSSSPNEANTVLGFSTTGLQESLFSRRLERIDNFLTTAARGRLTITPRGSVASQTESYPLPYMLGDLISLPFVQLPADGQSERIVERDIAIPVLKRDDPARFGALGLIINPIVSRSVVQGKYKETVRVVGADPKGLDLEVELDVHGGDSDENYQIDYQGTARLDFEAGLITHFKLTGKHTIRAEELEVALPLSVEMTYVSADQVAANREQGRRDLEARAARSREQAAQVANATFMNLGLPITAETFIKPNETLFTSPEAYRLSPDGRFLGYIGSNRAKLYDCETGDQIQVIPTIGTSLVWASNSRAWCASVYNQIKIYHLDEQGQSPSPTTIDLDSQNFLTNLQFSPDANWIAVFAKRTISLWDTHTGEKRWETPFKATVSNAGLLYFDPAGDLYAIGVPASNKYNDFEMAKYSAQTGEILASQDLPKFIKDQLRVDFDKFFIDSAAQKLHMFSAVSGYPNQCWDLTTMRPLAPLPENPIRKSVIAWGSGLRIPRSANGELKIYSLNTGKLLGSAVFPEGTRNHLYFFDISHDGRRIAAKSYDDQDPFFVLTLDPSALLAGELQEGAEAEGDQE